MSKKRVAFLHPDLGIGGAERLVVDAAVALKETGNWDVTMFTSHHEQERCFEETRDGTLNVVVGGDFFPRHLFGRFHAFFAYLRQVYLAIIVCLFYGKFDAYFVDQVSACIPVLKLLSGGKILFYCHYPDKLLTQRQSLCKTLYRYPLDWFEEWTTGLSDVITVNSKYTQSVFASSFKRLSRQGITPAVLYPALNLEKYDRKPEGKPSLNLSDNEKILLSINRFERKKELSLAIRTLAMVKAGLPSGVSVRLVMAGGYDPRLAENVEVLEELKTLSAELGVDDLVTFVPSFSEADRYYLLKKASVLLYTPANEHFGIVPLEAMYSGLPVLAVASGGPLESVVEGKCGYLRKQSPDQWSEVVLDLVQDAEKCKRLGEYGRSHVGRTFSLSSFRFQLEEIMRRMLRDRRE